jgi:hypothetical protein
MALVPPYVPMSKPVTAREWRLLMEREAALWVARLNRNLLNDVPTS